MLLKAMKCVALVSVLMNAGASDSKPHASLRITNPTLVVGEPIVVDFIVSNNSASDICSPRHVDFENARISFTIRAHAEDGRVVEWKGGGAGCVRGIGGIAVLASTGECRTILRPGSSLRSRKLVVLLNPAGTEPGMGQPIGPGTYELVGYIPWGAELLETPPVQIEVSTAHDSVNRRAASMVDNVYATFCDTGVLGMDGLLPAGPIVTLVGRFPSSVHARVATSRLLVLQAERLASGYAIRDAQKETTHVEMRALITRIDEHLRANSDDPLALDLLDGKVQLLRRLEDEDGLRKAIDALIRRFPDSGRARRAEELWRQLQSDPGDEK